MAVSQSLESYKHKFAKQVLVNWLREATEQAGYGNCVYLWGMAWKANRPAPLWGVFEEYPVSKTICRSGDGAIDAWDEYGDYIGEDLWRRMPTYQELIDRKEPPLVIFDVAVLNKGSISYAFEVVHKSAPSPEKVRRLCRFYTTTFVLEAEWILQQVGIPEEFKPIAAYGQFAPMVRWAA